MTRVRLVEAARRYKSLRYGRVTRVAETPDGPRGYTDCVGLFFLVARDCGLVPSDFDPNLPPSTTGVTRERACFHFLTRNFASTLPATRRAGDVLLVRFDHVAEGAEKHVVLYLGHDTVLHACDDGTGSGRVWEHHLSAHEIAQIAHCYSLKNFEMEASYG